MNPGFESPVLGAQSSFRAMLHALSHPGRIMRLADLPAAPLPLNPAAGAAALALCDADTPIWHDAGPEAAAWLRFHTGAPEVAAHEARFAIVTRTPPALARLCLGSDEAPQDGATLLLQVAGLEEAPGWALTGPGIEHETALRVTGLPAGFVAERAALAPMFPRGLDIILCAGALIAALPRTTRIEERG